MLRRSVAAGHEDTPTPTSSSDHGDLIRKSSTSVGCEFGFLMMRYPTAFPAASSLLLLLLLLLLLSCTSIASGESRFI